MNEATLLVNKVGVHNAKEWDAPANVRQGIKVPRLVAIKLRRLAPCKQL